MLVLNAPLFSRTKSTVHKAMQLSNPLKNITVKTSSCCLTALTTTPSMEKHKDETTIANIAGFTQPP